MIENYLSFEILTQKYKSLKISVDFEVCVKDNVYSKYKLLITLISSSIIAYVLNYSMII